MQSDDGQKEQNKKDEEYLTVKVRLFILPFNEEHVCIANHKLAFFTEELYDKHSQVAIDEDITQHRGLDLVDHDKVKSFHIQRQEPFQLLKVQIFDMAFYLFETSNSW